MANTIFQLRRNAVSGTRPTTSTVSPGELAINTTDGILFSANATTVFEIGSNNTNIAVGNSTVRQTVNASGVYVNGDINLVKNNTKLIFNPTAAAGAGNVYFIQQSDDNFVFYNTTNTGATKAVFNVYANTNAPNQNSAIRFNVPVDMATQGIYANSSLGSAGQVLTSNGTSVYWSTVSAGGSVNTAAQYTWTNTHTFQANVSFTGNGIGVATNTGALYLNSMTDANWRIGRSTGAATKWSYVGNTIDIIVASSTDEGFSIGVVGANSVFETGFRGTYIASNVTIGNSSVSTTINSTAFSGAANSATYANSSLYANSSVSNLFTIGTAAYHVANGNFGIGTNSPSYKLDVAGVIRGQASALSGDVLIIGNDTKLVDIDVADTAGLYSTSNTLIGSLKLGSNGGVLSGYNGSIGIANTAPDATLKVTGTANVSGNVVIGGTATISANLTVGASGELILTNGVGIYANGSVGTNGQLLTSNGSSVYWSTPASYVRQTFTANSTVNTTFTVTGGYTTNYIDVYKNGVKLVNGTDVTVSDGSTVVLASAALSGDYIDVVGVLTTAVFNVTVNTAAQYVWSNTHTFNSNVTVNATISDTKGSIRTIPQNSQTSAYILVANDVGKHISITTGGVSVPGSVFSAGDVVSIYNNSSADQTITQGASVTMYLGGTSTTGNRTLAQRGLCTVLCVASNTFVISGAGLT